jgi:predicted alpha/beta-hydrolase family hydrolase
MTDHETTIWRVAVNGEETTAAWDRPHSTPARRTVFLCAHGAGGHMDDKSLVQVSQALSARGLDIVRFNFLYREGGSGRPDPMPRLLRCLSAVLARTRDELRPDVLLLGGRSMGGRAASMLVAAGETCDGLLLLAYPLHPAGQTEKQRTAHLSAIRVPVLCFNGTRDALCRKDLMDHAVRAAGPRWTMHWLEGTDHSFHVLKRSGTTDGAVLEEVASATQAWLGSLTS